MSASATNYAQSGDGSVAYQVSGDGPIDVVLALGFVTHLELQMESPPMADFVRRLASFSRLIRFDKRGCGLSDPIDEVQPLEERADDVLAVMDAVGSERAAIIGVSEGGPMSALIAATHPDRISELILFGAMARTTSADDYPWALPAEAYRESAMEFILPHWGRDSTGIVELFTPSLAGNPEAVEFSARLERMAASPAMIMKLQEMYLDTDVRAILPAIHVPTLVMHREHDRVVNRRAGQAMAEQIPNARYVEFEGRDHTPWTGDVEAVIGEIEEFLTGSRSAPEPDRALATVMFTDIVGSTARASQMGDGKWRELLTTHDSTVGEQITRFRGRKVKSLGDGYLATFDGPARAIECGRAITQATAEQGVDVRVGIHSGEVELIGEDVGGIAVHIAARVGALAGASEVLVSSTVKELVVGSGIAFTDRGSHELKGVEDQWRLFAATA